MTGAESSKPIMNKHAKNHYECPNGCYIPLIDRIGASHRHKCPECGTNLVRSNKMENS